MKINFVKLNIEKYLKQEPVNDEVDDDIADDEDLVDQVEVVDEAEIEIILVKEEALVNLETTRHEL